AAVAVADLNGDGKTDIITPDLNISKNAAFVCVLLGNGDGTFGAPATFATGALSSSIAVADVNRDGKVDLVVGNEDSDSVSVLLGNGDGKFQSQVTFATGDDPVGVRV